MIMRTLAALFCVMSFFRVVSQNSSSHVLIDTANCNPILPDSADFPGMSNQITQFDEVVVTQKRLEHVDRIICSYPYIAVETKIRKAAVKYLFPKGDIPALVYKLTPLAYSMEEGDDGLLYIAGSRCDATKYMVDGVDVIGDFHVPLISLQMIQTYYFGIPAKYGDVTGGVIEVTTSNFRSYYMEY